MTLTQTAVSSDSLTKRDRFIYAYILFYSRMLLLYFNFLSGMSRKQFHLRFIYDRCQPTFTHFSCACMSNTLKLMRMFLYVCVCVLAMLLVFFRILSTSAGASMLPFFSCSPFCLSLLPFFFYDSL